MINLGKLATNVLNSIDNAAKESLVDQVENQQSATEIRAQRKLKTSGNVGTPMSALTDETTASEVEVKVKEESGDEANAPSSKENTEERSRDEEIEALNAECLELEDQIASLKKEVQDAWGSYKSAQEKAAVREAELQDEIRQLQRAKQTDKQSLLSQMGKVGEEVDEAVRQMRAMQAERDNLQSQLRGLMDEAAKWEAKEAALEGQLAEARAGSIQGVQGLREEMRAIVAASEQMRQEHASVIRQSQVRQAELEQANVELTIGITEKQREITRLKLQLEQAGKEDNETAVREVDGVRQQMNELTAQLEYERQKSQQLERRARQAELEAKASLINWEDEKQRLQSTVTELESKAASLEDKLAKEKGISGSNGYGSPRHRKLLGAPGHGGSNPGNGGGEDEDGALSGSSSGILVMTEEEEIKADLMAQIQNLTKQLLKKQGLVLELQAERAALKSRAQDLQARCSKAEQQLAVMRDLEEEGDVGDDFDRENGGNSMGGGRGNDFAGGDSSTGYEFSSSSSSGLRRRGEISGANDGVTSYYGGLGKQHSHKVIADLEKIGVKPTESVARAVNMIDAWTFMTGKFLRRYPLVRLGFILYLLILHIWVFIILAIHTHSLELDTTPQQALK